MSRLKRASPYLLAGLLTTTGVLHFAFPEPYDGIIPDFLPAPRAWTYGSGVVELACAAGLVAESTRRRTATLTALLFVAVFPANIQQAVHPGSVPRWVAIARLPFQVPLVLWAWQVRRASAGDGR